jgi:hypothetical protein
VITRREARRRLFAPGDLKGVIFAFTDKKPLLKVTASTDQIRFDPATWCIRRDFRATQFGKKLDYLSFKIAGWKHRDYTDEEWVYLEELADWGNREGKSSWRPTKGGGIDVLDWPIVMNRTDQKFQDAFDRLVVKLGPKRHRISVSEFGRLKKEALWESLQEQRKRGDVDPDLEGVNHWSM